jgi:predicted flap endonuclease-1-like 5' DNA nuclease
MTNPIHLLSVAALLLVAFLVGATVGTLCRLLAMRLARKPAIVAAAPVEAKPTAPPLVITPVIAPLPVGPKPVVPPPAEVPVPDFAATLIALADEKPPAAFLEAAKPRPEPATAMQPLPAVRAMPAIVPLPAVETVQPATAMQPAHQAGETTSGLHVAAPRHENPVEPVRPAAVEAEPRSADVIPFRSAPVAPPAKPATDMVVGGEAVMVVDTSDLDDVAPVAEPEAAVEPVVATEPAATPAPASIEDDFLVLLEEAFVEPEPVAAAPDQGADEATDTVPVPAIAADAAIAAAFEAELPAPQVIAGAPMPDAKADPIAPTPLPEPVTEEPAAERVETPIEAAVPVETQPVEQVIHLPPPPVEPPADIAPAATANPVASDPAPAATAADQPMDEDAAMRAIEGSGRPRRPVVKPPRPVAAPEGVCEAVAASARAVTAARRTAEAVLAEVAEVQAEVKAEAGRPEGLNGPRDGRKDDLTHIIGVLPVIETALNSLGLYHFDQVGALTDEQTGWIENHLGVPGRISRELWREQARELSAVLRPKRVAEK